VSALGGWPAPAKLNLFLHVTGRRADGYHELQTAFQLLDLADTLEFIATEDGMISRDSGAATVKAEDDLAVRAAHALRAAAGRADLGVRIAVRKRIPIGGGLGGASSDAATSLVALNRLWRLELTHDRLAELGLGLGADVPLFVRGRSAWAEGIGERLTPIALAPSWFAIVYPGIPVLTREVFQAPELTRNSPVVKLSDFLAWQDSGRVPRNDLAAAVVARYPAVRRALDWLAARGAARLTVSGACAFIAVPTQAAAQAALIGLPGDWQGFVARGLDDSPLIARRAAEV
jgi:4-diphosphocytidyl-2-C-methyl-D-erythritol kinase